MPSEADPTTTRRWPRPGSPGRRAIGITVLFGIAAMFPIVSAWNGRFDASSAFSGLLIGLSLGALYAMYASGLVLIHTTTGMFNFSQAAIGALAAFVYWQLTVDWGWPVLLSLIVVIGIGAPLLGIAIDVLLMRRVRDSALVTQLMVTVGLMVLFLSLVGRVWPQNRPRSLDPFFDGKGWNLGPTTITWHRTIVLLLAAGIAVGLRALFRSHLGIAMRAVVNNPELASLNGVPPKLVSGLAWALGSAMAALAGILVAPSLDLTATNLNSPLVWAIAAAAFGQLRSLPLTILGAALLGVGQQYVRQFLSFGGDFQFAADSLSALVLLVVVLAVPATHVAQQRANTSSNVVERTTSIPAAIAGAVFIVLGALALSGGWLNFGIWNPGEWSPAALNSAGGALTLAVIGISIVPLTGWIGEVNLAPLGFAGFGAYLYLHLPVNDTGNVLWLFVIAALTAVLGAAVAWPFARLSGLYLALGSVAFAHAMSTLFFPHPSVFSAEEVTSIAYLDIGFMVLDDRRAFMIFLTALLAVLMVGLVWLRNGTIGRRWVAIRQSPAAASAMGINALENKTLAYALSAAIAGVGGALATIATQSADAVRQYELIGGLSIVLLIAVAGTSRPSAFVFVLFIPVSAALVRRLEDVGTVPELVTLQEWVGALGIGLAALGLALHPRGFLDEVGPKLARLLPWRAEEPAFAQDDLAEAQMTKLSSDGVTRMKNRSSVRWLDRKLGADG